MRIDREPIPRLIDCVRESSLVGLTWAKRLQPNRVVFRQALKEANDIKDAVVFTREMLGFSPDAQQEKVLRGGRRGIVNCTRQWGKSTVTAAKAVHRVGKWKGRFFRGSRLRRCFRILK